MVAAWAKTPASKAMMKRSGRSLDIYGFSKGPKYKRTTASLVLRLFGLKCCKWGAKVLNITSGGQFGANGAGHAFYIFQAEGGAGIPVHGREGAAVHGDGLVEVEKDQGAVVRKFGTVHQ